MHVLIVGMSQEMSKNVQSLIRALLLQCYFLGQEKFTVLKEEWFSTKWENWALKNARVRWKTVLKEERLYITL